MAFYLLVALLCVSHGSILSCTAHRIGTNATASISPMDYSPFRACLSNVALLADGADGYAFFKPRASKAGAPWVDGGKVSMMACVRRGLCTYKSVRELTQGTQFKLRWKTSEIVSTCMADYQEATSATLYTLGNVHRAASFVPFLGSIMQVVREGGREIAKRSGEHGAALAAREKVAVAGSSYDLQHMILKELNNCVQQMEKQRLVALLENMRASMWSTSSMDYGEDLLEPGSASYCQDLDHGEDPHIAYATLIGENWR
eukprot:TRINITY_DN3986_c0_g4_i1.p1 TRINITY_DN3986_c0_g4~~TRINITY_DN3986_c0_g4_i1.p1  ORF type:complete len:259 (-),score=16.44 TRINITY_DN3986_c0_g4_i1:307-1083(-)